MELVIMAAGMGSRFGGLKQIEPIGRNGEFIIDYSIYDAIRCGFNKVIFIIKKENYDIFRETIGKRIENKINVEYVFQSNDNIPKNIKLPENRIKPLGTSHAILCCKDVIKENFAVINADDFYGYDAYKVISDFIKNNNDEDMYAMAGYMIKNTLTENGSVKRGVCIEKKGYLEKFIESSVEKINDEIVATPLDGGECFKVNDNTIASMNMFALSPKFVRYLDERFESFLEENKDNLDKCEYLLPTSVSEEIEKGLSKVKMLKTTAVWHGMTYKEDKEDLVNSINELIDKGEYPEKLWD